MVVMNDYRKGIGLKWLISFFCIELFCLLLTFINDYLFDLPVECAIDKN